MANVKKSAAVKTRKARLTPVQFAKQHCKGMGAVEAIVAMGKKGYDQKQIIEAGYNKNTVYRQYREQVMA
jgi:hypothetical protein